MKRWLSVLVFWLALPMVTWAIPHNLVDNGSFEHAWGDWKSSGKLSTFDDSPAAAEGSRWVGVDLNIYQDIATVPGQHYQLSFALAGESEHGQKVRGNVAWNNAFLKSLLWTPEGKGDVDPGWNYYNFDVVATSFNTRLLFENAFWGRDQTIYLDSIELKPTEGQVPGVPDPVPVALFPVVLILLGLFQWLYGEKQFNPR